MKNSWGYHLLLDCKEGDLSLITEKYVIEDFVHELIREIDMVPYGNIVIDRFATHDSEKAGISFCQMIETSHIAGHFCENTGDFYLDVFSCKEFDSEIVVNLVNKNFFPKNIEARFLSRDANGE